MRKDQLFARTKIKMVMRLRGVSHDEAVELILNGKAAAERLACKCENTSHRAISTSSHMNDFHDLISAEEFFGGDVEI